VRRVMRGTPAESRLVVELLYGRVTALPCESGLCRCREGRSSAIPSFRLGGHFSLKIGGFWPILCSFCAALLPGGWMIRLLLTWHAQRTRR
jgi:hypothetical protein